MRTKQDMSHIINCLAIKSRWNAASAQSIILCGRESSWLRLSSGKSAQRLDRNRFDGVTTVCVRIFSFPWQQQALIIITTVSIFQLFIKPTDHVAPLVGKTGDCELVLLFVVVQAQSKTMLCSSSSRRTSLYSSSSSPSVLDTTTAVRLTFDDISTLTQRITQDY